jgi:hypothetical protein
MKRDLCYFVILSLPVLLCACQSPQLSQGQTAYKGVSSSPSLSKYSPVFLVDDSGIAYNRIGSPAVRQTDGSEKEIYVDPDKPAVYCHEEKFTTDRGTYTNLIYRVHFSEVPMKWHLSGGPNVGVLAIVTVFDDKPVLITTVHTCGGFLAVVPTDALLAEAYPSGWSTASQSIYGETLPGRFDCTNTNGGNQGPILVIRSDTHRIREIRLPSTLPEGTWHDDDVALLPMTDLQKLATPDGGTTSFFYEDGPRQGYVKGSEKPLEAIFRGWWTLDGFVGRDKAFACEPSSTPFYTSTKYWDRDVSDLRNFSQCLAYYGWKL